MPLIDRSFSDIITFTRASTATFFNSSGVLTSAAINEARFDYNPATLAARGLLIEEARTNLIDWSASFRTQTLAVTSVSGAFTDGETVTASGGGTGTYYAAESTGSSFVIYQGSGAFTGTLTGSTSGQTATISSATGSWSLATATLSLVPNIAVAPSGTTTGADWTENTANSTRFLSRTVSILAGQTITVSLFVKQKPGAPRHFRIQTASVGTNGFNAYFDLTNGTVAVQTTALGTGTAVANSAVITPVGNGWYLISASGTVAPAATAISGIGFMQETTTGSAIYTGDGTSGLYIWGAQIEVGSFATSYIPTTTTALTRSADVASVNTLSPWYNATEGTLYGEVSSAAQTVGGVSRRIANLNDGTEADRITVGWAGATAVGAAFVTDNSAPQASFTSTSGAYPFPTKVALAYKAADFQAAVNGSAFATVSSGTVPTVNRLTLGDVVTGGTGPQNLNGHIRRVVYYPRRLAQAELVSITS
jgi:hypothetical protein